VIAIATAGVALVISLVAVIVVANRGGATASASQAGPVEQTVAADDVIKLRRESIESVTQAGTMLGVKVTDDKVRKALGLEPTDIITAIAGRAIKREIDVYEAVQGMKRLDPTTIYVDVLRSNQPVLLRWKLDGDLRTAGRAVDALGTPGLSLGGSSGSVGILGGTGSIDPSIVAPSIVDPSVVDPVLATIKKLDDGHYEIPRATVDKLLANPLGFMKGMRVVPAMKNGKPEGFKLYAIRPSSFWASIGFSNGDTVRAVNGYPLDAMDKALEVYTKLRDANTLEIDIVRRGKPVVLTITIN